MPIRGLREEAYRTGKAVYHNDFSNSEWVEFMPEGHASLDNVLFAPLMIEGEVVGLLGLANKPDGFSEDDARIATAFGELASIALYNSRTLESLEDSEERFRSVTETANDAIVSIDNLGNIILWNEGAEAIFGYSADEIIGKPVTLIMPERFHEAHRKGMERILTTGKSKIVGKTIELAGLRKDGGEFPLELSLASWKTGEEVFFTAIIRDVTERKDTEQRQQLAGKILERLNEKGSELDIIRDVLELIKGSTCFEAVGIRLHEGDDFPYFIANGFGAEFIEAEKYLCARNQNGEIIYDSQGKPHLECMCGNVLSGRTNPAMPFFTEGGSFWTNSTTKLLASTSVEERMGYTRNRCNTAGYESLALIPLRSGEEIIGLLQLNDRWPGRFTPEMIGFFEGIGASIGIALARIRAEEARAVLLHDMGERVKEISCMYQVAKSSRQRQTLEEIFQDIAALIPPGWHYPEITRAKVLFEGAEYVSEAFEETEWKQTSDLIVGGERCGSVEVYYLAEKPKLDEGPFLREERNLIDGIAGALSEAIEHKLAQEQIENLAKFPSEDPYPILRIAKDGTILYANSAGSELLEDWGCEVGSGAPEHWYQYILRILGSGSSEELEIACRERLFSLITAPVVEAGYVNIYGIDITERKQAEEDLREYRHHLEELVEERTGELTEANKQLLEEVEGRKRLEKEILNISEREQQRLGQELHDSLGQQLTGVAFMTKVLEQKLTMKSPEEAADVAEIAKLVSQATVQARGLARGLHPVDLDASSLMSSLEELAASMEQLFGVRCTFECDKPVEVDDTEMAVHLYRIAQEAVTNAIKHGRAKNIRIGLAYGRNKSVMTVKSDGLDFPEEFEARGTGMGLQIMDHRADIIGGSLDIGRGAKGGTIVTCGFPGKKRSQ
jgi:PAS domain S-box-containing protein